MGDSPKPIWRQSAAIGRVSLTALALCLSLAACTDPRSTGLGPGDQASYGATLRIADAARDAGDYATAINLYRRAASMTGRGPEPLIGLGLALIEVRSFNEAVVAYRDALSIAPNNVDAHRGLGNAFVFLDQLPAAREQFEAALRLTPGDARLHNSHGVVLDMAGDHRAAQDAYGRSLAIQPNNLTVRNNLGLSYALAGNFDQAIATFMAVVTHPEVNARHRQNFALVYGLAGDDQSAARLARMDLEEQDVQRNLAYYAQLRSLADQARRAAIGLRPSNFRDIVKQQ